MAVLCEVCQECNSKYKCSTCYSPYCSKECWNSHKNEDNCHKKKPLVTQESHNVISRTKYFTEDTVSEEELRLLGESEKLRTILKDIYLQHILVAVDEDPNPEEAIRQAMKIQEFSEFVDECLKIIKVTDN